MKRLNTAILFLILFVVCCTGASAATLTTVSNGNWTTPGIWDSNSVPTSADAVRIYHAVTITNDVGTVGNGAWDGFTGNASGHLIMNAGSLTVNALRWNSIGAYTITNNSVLTFSGSHQNMNGTWLVDNSTLNAPPAFTIRTGNANFTFRNGSTGSLEVLSWWDRTGSITNEGSLNTLSMDRNSINNADVSVGNFVFVMDNTDAAISTIDVTTILDLTLAAEWNLIIDVTKWNKVNGLFTLFDCTTLTGTFDSIQFIGGDYGPEAVIYDTDNGLITLDIRPTGTVIMMR